MQGALDSIRDSLRARQYGGQLIVLLLCALFCAEMFFSARRVSQTADEPTHLYSGYRYLVCGDLTISPEHPPLAKMIAALPILPMNVAANCEMFPSGDLGQAYFCLNWLYSQDWRSALARARFAISEWRRLSV